MHNRATLIGSGVAVTHFKDGKTMLVGCAAISIGSQSRANRPDICRTSGDDLLSLPMTCEVDRLSVIHRQSADHGTSAGQFQRTSPDNLPTRTIIGDIARFTNGLEVSTFDSLSTESWPIFTMFARASPDYL